MLLKWFPLAFMWYICLQGMSLIVQYLYYVRYNMQDPDEDL